MKFGDAGDAKILSFEVTDVTKPLLAARRMIEKEHEVHCGAENFIRNANGGKIPMRSKGGLCVIDIEINVRRKRS